MLKKTRYSLYYLASYLMLTGIAFLLIPDLTLRILFAQRTYDDIFVRFVGSFMVALSVVVIQIIRYRLDVLYPTTIGIRVFFVICITGFYLSTRDPLFIAILGVILVGVTATSISLFLDRSKPQR